MVSAWAAENRLVLGQVKADDKSNEITAISELLRMLMLTGCIVTIDAIGCQKDIAAQIRSQGADYVLALKGNQGNLYQDAKDHFRLAREENFKDIEYDYHEETDADHGRVEVRRCWVLRQSDWLASHKDWKDLKQMVMIEAERHIGEKVSVEKRYYITSLPESAKKIGRAVRDHWGIENGLHW